MSRYLDLSMFPYQRDRYAVDVDAIRQSLIRLLMTNKGDLIDEPEYGISLRDYLYEPITDHTKVFISMAIEREVRRWEDRVELQGIVVETDVDNYSFVVKLTVYIPEFDQYLNLEVGVD